MPSIYSNIVSILENNPSYKIFFDLLRIALTLITGNGLPIEAKVVMGQELEADKDAIRLTANKEIAKSCLLKLCNNDPNSISHYFELFGEFKPIMSMNQRISRWEEFD